jgi:hypothetical protein
MQNESVKTETKHNKVGIKRPLDLLFERIREGEFQLRNVTE